MRPRIRRAAAGLWYWEVPRHDGRYDSGTTATWREALDAVTEAAYDDLRRVGLGHLIPDTS